MGCLADIAGQALRTVARMRSLGAAEAQRRASRGGLACEGDGAADRESGAGVVVSRGGNE